MNTGETWLYVTVWLALGGYALSVWLRATDRWTLAKWAWVGAAIGFVFHVVLAFSVVHDWSHAAAREQTARDTETMTGVASGAGLWLNYLFAAIWMFDAAFWIVVGNERYRSRVGWIGWALHFFFIFMIVNGAVIFVSNWRRWIGIAIVAVIGYSWMIIWRDRGKPKIRI